MRTSRQHVSGKARRHPHTFPRERRHPPARGPAYFLTTVACAHVISPSEDSSGHPAVGAQSLGAIRVKPPPAALPRAEINDRMPTDVGVPAGGRDKWGCPQLARVIQLLLTLAVAGCGDGDTLALLPAPRR